MKRSVLRTPSARWAPRERGGRLVIGPTGIRHPRDSCCATRPLLSGLRPAGRIFDVRYEDVVADLETQARRIIAHCGLPWDERCLSFHETERPVRTASATQVRQPIYTSAVGRWRVYEEFLRPLLNELR